MPSRSNPRKSDDDPNPDKAPAWRLLVELRTRITTQALPLRDGVEEAALKSIYDFFLLARETVAAHPDSPAFGHVVIEALNRDLRPFTARWHGRQLAGRLGSVDERYQFRRELDGLRAKLAALAQSLADLCGNPLAETAPQDGEAAAPAAARTALPFGIVAAADQDEAVIEAINAAEAGDVLARRSHYGRGNVEEAVDAVGLALSGGGIRSSTFSLGVAQVLARQGMLQDVDFLSTVSGGGYLGSFINTVLDDPDTDVGLRPGERPFGGGGEAESAAVRHLRNHSKYLSEGGLATYLQLGFALLTGVITTLLLVSPFLILVALLLVGLGPDAFVDHGETPGRLTVLACGAWLAVAMAGIRYGAARKRDNMRTLERVAAGVLGAALLLSAVAALPALHRLSAGNEWGWLAAAACLPLALGTFALLVGPAGWAGRMLLGSLVLAVPLFFVAALLAMIAVLLPLSAGGKWLAALLGLALLVFTNLRLQLNFSPIQRFYRDRLARTYLASGGAAGQPVVLHEARPLSPACRAMAPKGPVHLINTALNVPGSDRPALRGRDSDFFVFGRHFSGSALTGWHPTAGWVAGDGNLDLGTAMAISGAAAAPHMGALTSRRYAAIMAMLNIRLGYWLRRPDSTLRRLSPWRRRPLTGIYFLKELFGRMREDDAYLNLSDGGHIENLGIYELLRRRCRTIVAIDGECDPLHQFDGLMKLVRMAWIDLNVRIAPDLNDLKLNPNGLANAHFVLARIRYPDEKSEGLLLYVKLSLTGDEPEHLRQYQQAHPAFPHESTAQQLYGETQWEAYRALGEHVGEGLFAEVLAGPGQPADAHDWVERLASRLLER